MRAKFKLKLTNHWLTLGFHAQPSFPHLPTVNWSQSILRIISLELFLFYELGGSSFLSLIQPGCKPGDICCPSWLRQIFPFNYWYSLQLLQMLHCTVGECGQQKVTRGIIRKNCQSEVLPCWVKKFKIYDIQYDFCFCTLQNVKRNYKYMKLWHLCLHPPILDIGPNFLCKLNLV